MSALLGDSSSDSDIDPCAMSPDTTLEQHDDVMTQEEQFSVLSSHDNSSYFCVEQSSMGTITRCIVWGHQHSYKKRMF